MKDLEAQIEKLKKEREAQDDIIAEYRKREEGLKVAPEEAIATPTKIEVAREQKKKKIGEILLAN